MATAERTFINDLLLLRENEIEKQHSLINLFFFQWRRRSSLIRIGLAVTINAKPQQVSYDFSFKSPKKPKIPHMLGEKHTGYYLNH